MHTWKNCRIDISSQRNAHFCWPLNTANCHGIHGTRCIEDDCCHHARAIAQQWCHSYDDDDHIDRIDRSSIHIAGIGPGARRPHLFCCLLTGGQKCFHLSIGESSPLWHTNASRRCKMHCTGAHSAPVDAQTHVHMSECEHIFCMIFSYNLKPDHEKHDVQSGLHSFCIDGQSTPYGALANYTIVRRCQWHYPRGDSP